MNFLQWVFYALPWWLQLLLLAIPVVVGIGVAINVFGWDRVKAWIVPALGILAALGLYSRARQQGYADRKTVEDVARNKAEDVANTERDKVRKLPDDKLDREIDRWSKP